MVHVYVMKIQSQLKFNLPNQSTEDWFGLSSRTIIVDVLETLSHITLLKSYIVHVLKLSHTKSQ